MKRKVGIIPKSIHDYFRDGGVMFSASISYFFIVTIVPLCLFIVTIFGYILGGNSGFFEFFVEKLIGLFPDITSGITEELRKLIMFKGLGKISLLLYAILSFQLYVAINKSLEAVFKVRRERSTLGAMFFSIVVSALLVCLLLVSFALTSIVPLLNTLRTYLPGFEIGMITAVLIRYVIPLLIVQFAAIIIYIIVPNSKVRFVHAFWGGLFTALMLEVAKHLFTWYVGSVISLGTIYGSLAAFVMFLLWIFYSSAIFLIGGEIVHNLGEDARPSY
jgi:membrane protein